MPDLTFSDLTGKTMLIGMTYYTHDDQLIEQKQFWGKVVDVQKNRIIVQQKSGELISLPPDLRSVQRAQPGSYRLRSTGEVIENPDFLSTWIVHNPPSNPSEGADNDK